MNPRLQGKVMGGQQPISGSTIQLYAVNTGSTGGASTALITTTTVLTASDGSFNITGDYTCPSAGSQVYLTASGGNPGLSAGTNNAAIKIMVGLGSRGQLSASTNIFADEVTTVGTIAALYPYMTAYNAVGSTSADATDLANEFSVITEYMDHVSGTAPGPALPSGYYASSTELNTLADVMATCINSPNATPNDGSTCGSLLYAAKPAGGSAPTDTALLVMDILKNPTNNVTGILGI